MVWFDHEQGRWGQAELNRPITSGDRLSTGADGRAELRVGSSVLRIAPSTEMEVLRLDDERMIFQLHSGSLALRVRSREMARELELRTGEARLLPQRAGHYRLDREDDQTRAGVWRGSLLLDERRDILVETGQQLEIWRDSRQPGLGLLQTRWSALKDDAFGAWAVLEDAQDERSVASRYVSPEMTGAEELDRYGQWEQHPEYGALWVPFSVSANWAPYRDGRWTWVRPWGWTWVDDARWGFAPFHYGRWVHWRGRWGWAPGDYVARPVFAPALVAWVGASSGVSVSIQWPSVGWVPLAPREVFWPYYRHTPVYVDRINHRKVIRPPQGHNPVDPGYPRYAPGRDGRPGRGDRPDDAHWDSRDSRDPAKRPTPVRTGPIMYSNQGVPGAVTVVTRDVLVRRDPAAPAAIEVPRVEGRGHDRSFDRSDRSVRSNDRLNDGSQGRPQARWQSRWESQGQAQNQVQPRVQPQVQPQAQPQVQPLVQPQPQQQVQPAQQQATPVQAVPVPVRRARPAPEAVGSRSSGNGEAASEGNRGRDRAQDRESSQPARVREAPAQREEPRRRTPESRPNPRERQQSQ